MAQLLLFIICFSAPAAGLQPGPGPVGAALCLASEVAVSETTSVAASSADMQAAACGEEKEERRGEEETLPALQEGPGSATWHGSATRWSAHPVRLYYTVLNPPPEA